LALLLVGGGTACRTAQAERRQTAAYQTLSPEDRGRVDRGEIVAGMDTNAVRLAWGEPSEVVWLEAGEVPLVKWLYYRPVIRERPQWIWYPNGYGYGTYDLKFFASSWKYVAREVFFQGGRVSSWKAYTPRDP
jgi:hypothetical protein